MSIADKPTSPNFLNPSGFQLNIRRLPYVNFLCQHVSLPYVSLNEITSGSPFIKLNYASTEIDLGKLVIAFKVDENLRNYREILNWIKGLGFPEDFKQYRDNKTHYGSEAVRSDASLIITTSASNPNMAINFQDLFPIALSEFDLTTTQQDNIDYVTARAVFSIRDFVIENIADCDPDDDIYRTV